MKASSQGKRRTDILIAGGLAIAVLGLAFLLSNDFGQGWDDAVDAYFGRAISSAYSGSHEYFQFKFQNYYGPGYQLLQYQLSQSLASVLPLWKSVHTRYLVNFLFFQLGVVSLYFLARRFLSQAGALLAAALLLSQPLLFGHAFINHKDGVFLSLFTLSMASGLAMADSFSQRVSPASEEKTSGSAMRRPRLSRAGVLAPGLLLLLTLVDGALGLSTRLAAWLVTVAYRGTSVPALSALFASLAEHRDSIPLSMYIEKASRLSMRAHVVIAALSAIVLVVAVLGRLQRETRILYLRRFGLLLLAAASLGLATATRLAGPLAGVLVAVYFVLKVRRLRAAPAIVAYVATSFAATIALWPALWKDPIGHLLESFRVMSQFPAHDILFMGRGYVSSDLPWFFLPVSVALQLTEPTLLLIAVAILVSATSLARGAGRSPSLSLLPMALWFAIPLVAVPLFHLRSYNSFRHYLFILPPLFILAAFGAMNLVERTPFRLAKYLIAALVLAPGVMASLRLHPYEYVYYNSLARGVSGADGDYDLDYWCTSYKEAIEFLNKEAPPGAKIVVWGPVGIAGTFARPDLILLPEGGTTASPDYAMSCGPMARSPTFYETYDTVFEVTADGAVLARVKRAPNKAE